jgi:membrane-associated phospholipid phosphatase
VDVSVLASSATLLGLSLAWWHPASTPLPSRADIWPIDRIAIGRWSPAADSTSTVLQDALIVAGPLLLLATSRGDMSRGLKLALIEIEALIASAAAVRFVKVAVYRPRPEVFLGITGGTSTRQSFYSGHTTIAFTAVVATAYLYLETFPEDRAMRWAFVACGAVAAGVGVLRVVAGKHYPTDVLAGAAAGALIGWAVPALHRARRMHLSVGPGGLALQGRF